MLLFSRALSVAALLAVHATAAGAQQSIDSASVAVRAIDQTGVAIAGASISVRHVDRNQSWTDRTDERGRFTFLTLPPGQYEITASAPGFAERRSTLRLTAGQTLELPITLLIPGVSEAVTVSVEVPLIETRRTQAAETIQPREVDALPLNGRNYLDLALLAPGVSRTIQRNTERFAETSAVPGTGISIAGQRNLNNSFVLDGLSANDDAAGLAGTYLSQDVIREFQVITSGGVAEFGRASAGIVSIVTQSGSNTRHTRAYLFGRNDALDARNPLATREDPMRQAQYGATFSGPLRTDRTFWFANVEQTRLERTGVVTISPAAVAAINQTLDAAGYAASRIVTGEFPTGYDTTNVFGRVDHASAAQRHRFTTRYSLYDVASANARNVGGLNAVSRGTRLDNRDQTVAATLTSLVRGSGTHELRAQATRSRLGSPPNDLTGPAVNISGVANFGTATFSPTARDLDVVELSDALTVQRDSHVFKAGGSAVYERLTIGFPGALQGVYTFSSLSTFEAGTYINFQQAFGEPAQYQSTANVTLFAQDEWRAHRAVTVNAGLRYDVQLLAGPVRTDTNNLSPRLGLAIAPGDGRTVLRASGGLYFDRIPLRALSNALQRDGAKYRIALLSAGQPGAPVFPAVLPAFPDGVLTNITSIDPGIQNAASRQFNVQLEREVARGFSATAGYMYLAGRRIIMSRNVNAPTLSAAEARALGIPNLGRPDARIGNNSQFQSIGRSDFHGLVLSLRTHSATLGTARVSYTLGTARDDAGNAFFSAPQDNNDVAADYGRSDNDQRHRLVVSGTLPALAGIEVSYLYTYASAPPFNIQTGSDRNNDTTVNDRPAGVGRNTGEAFDFASFDVRLARAFHVRGRHRLEAIVDVFNLTNRANYLIPNNIYGTGAAPRPGFGAPTAAADPRQVQLGVRWVF